MYHASVIVLLQPKNGQFYKSLIYDKSVTCQNLAFLSYWYRKKRFADAFLSGILS